MTSAAYHIIIGSRDPAKGASAVSALADDPETKGTVSTVSLDITLPSSVAAAAAAVASTHGRLDVLVNNAGVYADLPGTALPEALAAALPTNVVGTARATEAFLPLLTGKNEDGATPRRLVFLTSAMASMACATDPASGHYGPYGDGYRASKAGVNMLMAQYAARLGMGEGGGKVKVFGVDPGFSATDINGGDKEVLKKMGAREPEVSAMVVARVVRGERDNEAGKVVDEAGVVPW